MASRPTLLYRALRGTMRAALRLFYRTIEPTGLEHLDGRPGEPAIPTILACNHPNSIVDPLLLGLFEERQIAFCARDGLFKIPVFGSVLSSVGAIPIKRRSEHASGADNSDAFVAARRVLEGGGVLAIFPEGKTHGNLRIEPLKTGAARIALGVDLGKAGRLRIVPVGVTYLVRHAFRSDVHVAFGEPIEVDASTFSGEPRDRPENVVALTAKLGEALRSLAVHIEKTEDERLIAQVTSIIVGIRTDEGLDGAGQNPAERTALVRRVVDAYHWLATSDPERTATLRDRIDRFMSEREELGLGGERPALQHRGERAPLRGAARAAFLALGAPFAAFGLATSLPPYVLLRAAMGVVPVTMDRVALFKLLGGAAVFSAAYAAEVAATAHLFGALPAALLGASLVPAAFFARRYVIETRLHRVQLRSVTAFRGSRLAALQAERKALAAELATLRKQYLDQLAQASEVRPGEA
ncbi:MAG: 1-acyl-sn-glycerol-3-phosphate acyltransferase [Polyangiaceae bacterium]